MSGADDRALSGLATLLALARAWPVRVAVSAALLALLWRAVDGPAALSRLAGADPLWLLAAVALLAAHTGLCALRWRLTAARLGQRIPLGRAVAECYLAQLVNLSLPGGILGDASRAVRASEGAGLVRAGQAVALERLAGQAALLAVLLPALALTAAVPGGLDWPAGAGIAGAALAGGLASLVLTGTALARRWPRPRRALGGLGRAAFAALLAPEVRRRQAALSLAAVALLLAGFWCCAQATGTTLSPGATAALGPLILLAMLVPLSVGGWGLREGAAAALWPLLGAVPGEAAAGVAASAAFGFAATAASLPGLLPLLRRRRARARAREVVRLRVPAAQVSCRHDHRTLDEPDPPLA